MSVRDRTILPPEDDSAFRAIVRVLREREEALDEQVGVSRDVQPAVESADPRRALAKPGRADR